MRYVKKRATTKKIRGNRSADGVIYNPFEGVPPHELERKFRECEERIHKLQKNVNAACSRRDQLDADVQRLELTKERICSDKSAWHVGLLGKRPGTMRDEAKALVENIDLEISSIKSKTYRFEGREYSSIENLLAYLRSEFQTLQVLISKISNAMYALRENSTRAKAATEVAARETVKKEKQERILAMAQAHAGLIREASRGVLKKLSKNHPCPYCFGDLGKNPHADHIHPVSKGGQAKVANMVYVCACCNAKKRDMTLNQFIENFQLDRSRVFAALRALGKDY